MSSARNSKIMSLMSIMATITLVFLIYFISAIMVRLPSPDYFLYVLLGCCIVLLPPLLWNIKRLTKAKVRKQLIFFALLYVMFTVSLYTVLNVFLGLRVQLEFISTVSVIASTPLACLVSGIAKSSLLKELEKLTLENGMAIMVVVILSVVPLAEFTANTLPFTMKMSNLGIVSHLPPIIFLNTENTTIVNGIVNDSGFFGEIIINGNQTINFSNVTEIRSRHYLDETPGTYYSTDLSFSCGGFSGDFNILESLHLYAISNSSRVDIVGKEDGFVKCYEPEIALDLKSTLSLGVECVGTGVIQSNGICSIVVLLFPDSIAEQRIILNFKTAE